MEITVTHNQLQSALEVVSRVSTKHVTLPILQCTRLVATPEAITLQATNLEISVAIPLSGTVTDAGDVAIPAQVFLQSLQFLSDQQITLRVEDGVLQIETKTGTTSIKTFSVEEFPTIHPLSGDGVPVTAKSFAAGIKSVAFAASQTSIKPELGSVFMQQKREHSLTLVATDSFRLVEKTVSQKQLVLESSVMIPHKNALELAKVCDSLEGDPVLLSDENVCALRFPNGAYISSRLVTGSFPDYAQIIPKEFCTHVTVLRDDLIRVFKKTGVFLNKFRQVTLTVTSDHVTVSAQNSDVGQVTDTVPATVDGEEITLSFNQQYLLDPLSVIQDESVRLSFAGVGRALIMTGVADTSVRYLVMPMNK